MNLNKFEKFLSKIGSYLPKYIKEIILYGSIITLVFTLIVSRRNPMVMLNLVWLRDAILGGQIWRVFTFIFDSYISTSPFEIFSILFLYYAMNGLSEIKGVNYINGYFLFTFVLFNILGMFVGYVSFAPVINMLFVIYALQNPHEKMFFNFFIPIPMWVFALIILYFMHTSSPLSSVLTMDLVFLVLNYKTIENLINNITKKVEKKPLEKAKSANFYIHKCEVCGKTDVSDPNMTFRFCSKCDGNFEYCEEHLANHEHKSNIIKFEQK